MAEHDEIPFRRVYHLNRGRLLVFPVMWLLTAAFALALTLSETAEGGDGAMIARVLLGVMTVIVALGLGLLWQSRLVLTADGIAHHQFGYSVRSDWDNVAAIDLRPGNPSLVLHRAGTNSRLLRASVSALDATIPVEATAIVGDMTLLREGRLILLTPFMSHWHRGPLQSDLRRLAPHLFDERASPPSAS